MLKGRCWALLITLLMPAVSALPQSAKKIPVAVSHSGDDQVGQQFAFALKEAIRASQSFRFVDDDPAPSTARIVVFLVSVESSDIKGTKSAIAQSIVYDSASVAGQGIFLTSSVTDCGRSRVESCAKTTLPHIDQAVERLRKNWSHLWKTLWDTKN